jgi:TolB-like protein
MKKAIVCVILACLFPVFVFSQNALTIDAALNNSTSYFSGRIPNNTKVVVLNFSSKWPDLSDYIIEELIGYIVNEGKLTVVDRQNLESIRKEMDFQLSGEVSDETAQSIGKKLGAQTIMSGAITAIGNAYRLRIRAISVETAQILGMQNVDVAQDSRIAALTGTGYTGPATVATNAPRAEAATANTTQTTTTDNTPQSSSTPVTLSQASYKWNSFNRSGSTVNIKTGNETIRGNTKEVTTIEIFLGKTGTDAGAIIENQAIARELILGNGVRFKAIGDGKGWFFSIRTKETRFYGFNVTTKNGQVVDVDVPFTRLRMPTLRYATSSPMGGFNKTSITGMAIERNNADFAHESGPATIKIFDLEIY